MKLHGHLCPPEFIPFHETLEKFFDKNFGPEIRRLAIDRMSDQLTVSNVPAPSQYQSSMYEPSLKRSMSSVSTSRQAYVIPQLQLGRSVMTPPPLSPQSPRGSTYTMPETPGRPKQTPLQRHLAHLARHGINGVSSSPRETGGSDTVSGDSPRESFVNVGNGVPATTSGASVTTSTLGSVGSVKGRLSRFGSLNFRRRGRPS